MLQEELTDGLRRLAAELDELASQGCAPSPVLPSIPGYRLSSILGRGGMGTVYRARQISLDREVAVKMVETVGESAEGFVHPDEAKTIAWLHHPNIVQIISAGHTPACDWYAMELVRGTNAARQPFASVEEVARMGISVAEALAYAHRCGFLHRDVKPSNIFIGDDGVVKLGDFGLACFSSDSIRDRSGTRRYLAPEVRIEGRWSEASDQYALGVTLRELTAHLPRVSSDFVSIYKKATALEPTDRYASVAALRDDLQRFLAHRPIAARRFSPIHRLGLFVRRNPLAAGGFIVVAVCLVVLGVALAVIGRTQFLAVGRRPIPSTRRTVERVHQERKVPEPHLKGTNRTRQMNALPNGRERRHLRPVPSERR